MKPAAAKVNRSSLVYYMISALALLGLFFVYVLISTDVLVIKTEKILIFVTLFFIFIYIIFEKREKRE